MTEGNEAARLEKIAGWATIGMTGAALEGIWSLYKMFEAIAEHDSYYFGVRLGFVTMAVVVGALSTRILFLAKAR